jgi:hypothetical protein
MFKNVLSKDSTLVSVSPSRNSEEQLYRAVYESVNKLKLDAVVWVCYQQTPGFVENKMGAYGLTFQSILFIDMISCMMGLKQEKENVAYCKSPTDYNCLMRYLDELLDKSGKGVVVIDNLNGMVSYDTPERVIKMLRSLNNRIPERESAVLYLETRGAFDSQTEIAIQTTMNHVVKLDGDEKAGSADSWQSLKRTSWRNVFSLKSPLLFALLLTMIVNVIFLTVLLLYVVMKS